MKRELQGIEIVAIGEELLSGATIDTNAARIAAALEPIGLRVVAKCTVGDTAAAISEAVSSALQRSRAVITTGGLGPTRDDVTKAAVAQVFDRNLEFNEDLWRELEERWRPLGKPPSSNRSQAEVPAGAAIFANPRGTAPGLALEGEQGVCILLPGVPGELEAILEQSVTPYLAQRAKRGSRRPVRRQLRTAGIAESAIAEKVGSGLEDLPLDVAYLPKVAGVDIRLTCWSTEGAAAEDHLEEGARRLREALGRHIYSEGTVDLAEVVGDTLRQRGMTVAIAESCTGGLLGSRLVERAGASDYFWGGIIVYDDKAKIGLAGVSEATLAEFGAVSGEAVRELAEGARRLSGSDCSVAVTGIAGPEGGTKQKPVGTVWIGVSLGEKTVAKLRHYLGTRDMIRARAAEGALDLLRRTLLNAES